MKTQYDFYADAGHGWLKVSLKELKELNLIDKITCYSYVNKNYAFLEEDCDLSVFIEEKKKRGVEIKFTQHHAKQSKIRSYTRFFPAIAEMIV
jgi:hypothetical protein